ncbi:MAG TPA: alpha-E domain-containing protein [Actinomycetota bacterium]|nr:alpha-E domain-containing protein [Actinomycetota bacterium]
MLSRIAELVYWIGRFTERAESVSKMVSSYHYSATQLGELEERSSLHDLIAAFGEHEDGETSFRSTAAWWVTSPENGSSAVRCIRAARENARRAREVLSLEVWESLNGASAALEGLVSAGASYELVADRIPGYTRALAGVVETTTPRDEAWEVMRLGTMLERAAMTLRAVLIGSQAVERLPADDPLALHAWTLTLRACTALDAYRRTSVAVPHGPAVVTLLLQSSTCPRSVAFALREVASLVPFGTDALAETDAAREMLAAPLEHGDGAVVGLADQLLDSCDRIHAAVIGAWRGGWEPS